MPTRIHDLPPPVDILGLPIRPFDADGMIEAIIERAMARVRTLGCYANAHTVNLACANPAFRRLLSECDVLFADGASMVWAGGLAASPLPCRITAMDYFPALARRCATEGLSLFLLGGRAGVAERAARALRAQSQTLKIVAALSGHFALSESPRVIKEINAARPDILVVGMSSPRQETWLAEHAGEIDAPVRWCVGALFDYLAGQERRAPAWLCRLDGEWIFRLLMDPGGKWRRYLLGNPLFVWHTTRWLTSRPQRHVRPVAICGTG